MDLANGQLAYLWILLLFHIKHLNKYKFYIYCFFLHQHSILLCFFFITVLGYVPYNFISIVDFMIMINNKYENNIN